MLEIGSYVDGKYKILNEINRGGMSVVYMAVNEKVNKTWAVKAARRDGIHDQNTAIQSLVADRQTLIGMNHPHLPSIVDVYENDTSMMIVMDYIEGNPLSKTLEEYGAQPQERVLHWARQLCGVLGYLHEKNIIYRDMKPSNIMLKPDGDIMLIDFGAAREFKEKSLSDTQCLGTIGYAAPEQFGGCGQTDARTDIFCLGATLHHLITGIDPCKESSFAKVPIRQVNPSLSGGLEHIIETCLKDDKNERYQSCADLMYALEHHEEADDRYKRKQKKKIAVFASAILMAGVFAIVSAFGYVTAQARTNMDYQLKIAAASDQQLSQTERTELFLEAIRINAADTAAYLHMLKLFLAGNEGAGSLTREEASVITQLKAGLEVQNGDDNIGVIYPLETLKSRNPKGYENVCYEVGMAYWYDYEVESERYTSAVEWLNETLDGYPIAKIYVDIGRCKQDIRKYTGQKRSVKMHEEYASLWERLTALRNEASRLDDNDTKLLAWREIIGNSSDKAAYFLVHIKKETMLALMDTIAAEAEALNSATKYEEVKDTVNEILLQIDHAKDRIYSVSLYEEVIP